MRRFRGVLTLSAFVALATVSMAAAVVVYLKRLPDPELADRQGLFRWMVTRDVSAEPPETQRKLLNRVQSELRQGIPTGELDSKLDAQQKATLRQNAEYLLTLWLDLRSAEYEEQRFEDRPEFLKAQVLEISQWVAGSDLLLAQAASETSSHPMQRLLAFQRYVEDLIQRAPEESQPRIRRFTSALVTQFLMNGIFGEGLPNMRVGAMQ